MTLRRCVYGAFLPQNGAHAAQNPGFKAGVVYFPYLGGKVHTPLTGGSRDLRLTCFLRLTSYRLVKELSAALRQALQKLSATHYEINILK